MTLAVLAETAAASVYEIFAVLAATLELLLTSVSKSLIVDADCVPAWLARANASPNTEVGSYVDATMSPPPPPPPPRVTSASGIVIVRTTPVVSADVSNTVCLVESVVSAMTSDPVVSVVDVSSTLSSSLPDAS